MSRRPASEAPSTVRDAEPRDRKVIRELLSELGYEVDAISLGRRIDRLIAEPSIRGFVAVLDGTVVGFASLHILYLMERPPLGRLSAIVVSGAQRRGGIGLALVEQIERAAKAAGCDRLEVTSGEWREDAHAVLPGAGVRGDFDAVHQGHLNRRRSSNNAAPKGNPEPMVSYAPYGWIKRHPLFAQRRPWSLSAYGRLTPMSMSRDFLGARL